MAEHEVPPQRRVLGARLRDLRARRFRSGSEMARALGWSQSRLSKVENGRQLLSQVELGAWLEATEATPEQANELRDLLGLARLSYKSWDDAWSRPGGITAAQGEIIELDLRAKRIAEYQPAVVPGIAQTPAYTRELLSVPGGPMLLGATPDSIEEKVSAQLQRQQRILYTPEKQIQLLMGEAALRNQLRERATLVGQLDRLITLADLPNVQLGVVPFAGPELLVPVAGFALNDSHVVWVETASGEQRLDDPAVVNFYVQAFEVALASARVGDDAVALIRDAMRQ